MRPVFIHISKNAGSSIIASAGDRIVVAGHQTALRWTEQRGPASRIFAVLRNPYDRVLSEYFYRKRRFESGENNPHLSNLDKPFREWVISTFRDGEFRTRAFFERSGVAYNPGNMIGDMLIWFIPQRRWLEGADGEILADDLLRFESLSGDWLRFTAKYGFSAPLLHHNASPRPPAADTLYSPETRQLVYDHYRTDFETFHYAY